MKKIYKVYGLEKYDKSRQDYGVDVSLKSDDNIGYHSESLFLTDAEYRQAGSPNIDQEVTITMEPVSQPKVKKDKK